MIFCRCARALPLLSLSLSLSLSLCLSLSLSSLSLSLSFFLFLSLSLSSRLRFFLSSPFLSLLGCLSIPCTCKTLRNARKHKVHARTYMHTQVREERDKIQQMLEAEQAARADEVAELHAEVERLQDKAVEAEAQRVRANEERERIESVLENFHEQNMSESSFEVEKLRKVVAARELEVAALQDKERELLATVAELQKAPVSSDLETQLAGG